MGKKYIVRLTEQELADLIRKNLLNSKGDNVISDFIKKILSNKPTISSSSNDTKPSKTKGPLMSGRGGKFDEIDLNTTEGYNAYEEIADNFIEGRTSNLLGIRGSMLADAAKNTYNRFNKYIPAELALAQLTAEGGFSNNPNSRPIKTKNPFNVGNVDSGANVRHGSVQSGIQTYYDLIAKNYLSGSKTASDLLNNFVNSSGKRYATDRNYETKVSQIANQVKNMGQPVYASLEKSKDTSSLS
jgi:hypothetical protein